MTNDVVKSILYMPFQQASLLYSVTMALALDRPRSMSTLKTMPQVGKQTVLRHASAASPDSETNNVLAIGLDIFTLGCPERQKLCFLCPVGLKEENLFTKA